MVITDPKTILNLIEYAFSGGVSPVDIHSIQQISNQTLYPDIETSFMWIGDTVYCITKGTEPTNFLDILTDLHFAKTPHTYSGWGKVHSGFLSSAQGIALCLAAWMRKFGDGVANLVFCGHSLGAALSLLTPSLALPLLGIPAENYHVIGIASPRVGDFDFCKVYNATFKVDQITSFVLPRDPVPHLPPTIFGFSRPGRDVVLKQAGTLFSHPVSSHKIAFEAIK